MMTQKTLEGINRKISSLENEIKTLRSFMIGSLKKDPEGEYKPEFIKRILKAAKEKPEFVFKDAKSFLKQIKKSS